MEGIELNNRQSTSDLNFCGAFLILGIKFVVFSSFFNEDILIVVHFQFPLKFLFEFTNDRLI